MTDKDILQLIKPYLMKLRTDDGYEVDVIESSIHKENEWWFVNVRPKIEIKKRYRLYEDLTDIETEIKKIERLDVFFVPVS